MVLLSVYNYLYTTERKAEKMSSIERKNTQARYILPSAVLLLAIAVVGRVVSYFYSITATDIAYADWVPSLLSYAGGIITAARTALSYSAVIYSLWRFGKAGYGKVLGLVGLITFLDFAARYIIDLTNGSISGSETAALIWVLLQFLYEFIFIVLAYLLGRIMLPKFASASESGNRRAASKYSPAKAVRYSVLLYTASRVFSEIIYLIDFLTIYSDITSAEIASIIGSFLNILIIYGAVAIVFAEVYRGMFVKE